MINGTDTRNNANLDIAIDKSIKIKIIKPVVYRIIFCFIKKPFIKNYDNKMKTKKLLNLI